MRWWAKQARISQCWDSIGGGSNGTGIKYVGIDVAKEQVSIAVRLGGRTWSVYYDEAGIDALVVQLNRLGPASVITESTVGLELPLVTALAAASLPVVVVNPRQVRDFAKSTGQLAKTDRLDAQVLAHFGEAVRLEIRALRDADTQALGAILARRRQVSNIIIAEKNRLGRATTEVRPRIVAHIDWLEQELKETWMATCAGGSVAARYGGRRTTCCAVFPG